MSPARLVVGLVLLAATVFGVARLADATQTRPDVVRPGTASTVVFDVETRGHRRTPAEAAQALWGVCSATISNSVVAGPAPGDHGWAVTVEPAIGPHGRERLAGCLRDATLDGVSGRVVEISSRG
jgi:hypothetical protein